jgi:hypothetical protein
MYRRAPPALIAENPMEAFVTRMQQWDYRLGINGVKRMQAAYTTALVAQGRFRPTGRATCVQSAGGPMRSVRTSC